MLRHLVLLIGIVAKKVVELVDQVLNLLFRRDHLEGLAVLGLRVRRNSPWASSVRTRASFLIGAMTWSPPDERETRQEGKRGYPWQQ